MFVNTIRVTANTEDAAKGFAEALETEYLGPKLYLHDSSQEDNTVTFVVKTTWLPLDDKLLELAAKYYYLDFTMKFECVAIPELQGYIAVRSLEVYYLDGVEHWDTPDEEIPEAHYWGNCFTIIKDGGMKCLRD